MATIHYDVMATICFDVIPIESSRLYQHYTPAKDRVRPHTLELLIRVPPLSTITITTQFSPAYLKWTEHPSDAHHGFYIK